MRRFLLWVALLGGLVLLFVPVAALTFSVQVDGHSMEPTVAEGDRLLVNPLRRDQVARFDLVEVVWEDRRVVKRVIGMPGDQVAVTAGDGTTGPQVLVREAGSTTTQRVDNPPWVTKVGDERAPCCGKDGRTDSRQGWATVPAGHYWIIGDNWGGSTDSRAFGFVPAGDVVARLNLRLLPLGDFGTVPNPASLVPAPAG